MVCDKLWECTCSNLFIAQNWTFMTLRIVNFCISIYIYIYIYFEPVNVIALLPFAFLRFLMICFAHCHISSNECMLLQQWFPYMSLCIYYLLLKITDCICCARQLKLIVQVWKLLYLNVSKHIKVGYRLP